MEMPAVRSILALIRCRNDIKRMLKKFTKPFKGNDTKSEAVAEAPEVRGQDAKTLAEMKADAAGEKWRAEAEAKGEKPVEVGGPKGLEPTRYGDWERAGRCVDF